MKQKTRPQEQIVKNKFYSTKMWQRARNLALANARYQCDVCGSPKDLQVHHIIPITLNNINDKNVTINQNNLQVLCVRCHNSIERGKGHTAKGVKFDKNGQLIKIK